MPTASTAVDALKGRGVILKAQVYAGETHLSYYPG